MSEQRVFDVNNTGIIGKNDYANTDKHPNKRGRAKINGLWFWISAWTKQSQNGEIDSLAFTLMTQDEADKAEEKANARNRPQQASQQQQQQAAPRQTTGQQQAQQTRQEGANNPDANQNFDDDIPF